MRALSPHVAHFRFAFLQKSQTVSEQYEVGKSSQTEPDDCNMTPCLSQRKHYKHKGHAPIWNTHRHDTHISSLAGLFL